LANLKSAIKHIRQDERRHVHNRMALTRMRTFVSKARASLVAGDKAAAAEAIREAASELDKAARTGIIHPNGAARRKSALMKGLNALQ
jgi:small subunit ribosomal protein S20